MVELGLMLDAGRFGQVLDQLSTEIDRRMIWTGTHHSGDIARIYSIDKSAFQIRSCCDFLTCGLRILMARKIFPSLDLHRWMLT